MRDRNIPTELTSIFQYWYANQRNSVRWTNARSDSYGLECGVRQGGLSSPKLFNLYVDGLISELSNTHVGCHVDGVCVNNISYADDMVLLSPSVKALRRLLNICESYASSHGLQYNVNKSEYMIFKAAGKRPEMPPLNEPDIFLNGTPLQRVYRFKYLGHYLTDDLKDHLDIERERRALAVRSNMLARRFARCSDQVKITLFKAFCQSFYTSSLWFNCTQKALSALRVQYNNGFRALLKLPRFCSASKMFAEARTDGFHAIVRKRTASLVSRMRSSSNGILKMFVEKPDSPMHKHLNNLMVMSS
ncbi:uncharacterized protein LOC134751227 [Cydia strobilella]|uniref:uncharacterized protein LOC134751227 n=1 Tax=Cydia strobilella TaxID=1100964 RepID=UPI003007E0B9